MAERPFAPLHVGCLPGGVIGLHGLMTLDAVINLKVDGSVGPACDAKSTPGRPPGSIWRHNRGMWPLRELGHLGQSSSHEAYEADVTKP